MNLRDSARGRHCQIRLPLICRGGTEGTVLAHFRLIGYSGIGLKSNDLFGAFGCSACHDAVDGRTHTYLNRDVVRLAHLEGVIRTQAIWIEEGLVTIP